MVMVQRTVAVSRHREVFGSNDIHIEALHTTEQMRQASTLLVELLRTLTDSGYRVQVLLSKMKLGSDPDVSHVQPLVQLVLEERDAESEWPAKVENHADGPMTARERSVLQLICQGLSNKKIARDLNIAPETVKSHTKHILCKLGTNTRAQAVAQAAKLGLL